MSMQYDGNVESTSHIPVLDKSFGLEDALRIRGLFDKRSGPEESVTPGEEIISPVPVCSTHGKQPDLGSWTPLDLLQNHRKKVVGRHAVSVF